MACPLLLAPTAIAPSLAISALSLMTDGIVNRAKYIEKGKNTLRRLKQAFCAQEGETASARRYRIGKNVTVVIGIVALGILGSFCLHALSLKNISVWNIYDLLPHQTKIVVFAEYLLLGIGHAAKAWKSFRKKEKGACLFHVLNTVLSVAFPLFYLKTATAEDPMRLHHSFLGIAASLMPATSLKTLGLFISTDSALYAIAPVRGGEGADEFESFDFQNLLLKHLPIYILVFTLCAAHQYWIKRILPQKKEV